MNYEIIDLDNHHHHHPLLGHFHHLKIFCSHLQEIPLPTSGPRQQIIYFLSLYYDLSILDILQIGTIQHVAFHDWLKYNVLFLII